VKLSIYNCKLGAFALVCFPSLFSSCIVQMSNNTVYAIIANAYIGLLKKGTGDLSGNI